MGLTGRHGEPSVLLHAEEESRDSMPWLVLPWPCWTISNVTRDVLLGGKSKKRCLQEESHSFFPRGFVQMISTFCNFVKMNREYDAKYLESNTLLDHMRVTGNFNDDKVPIAFDVNKFSIEKRWWHTMLVIIWFSVRPLLKSKTNLQSRQYHLQKLNPIQVRETSGET